MRSSLQSPPIPAARNDRPAGEAQNDALAQRVRRELRDSGYSQLRDVQVVAHGVGRVHLEGCVQSFYLKQIAQTAALGVDGVALVENRLRVCGPR